MPSCGVRLSVCASLSVRQSRSWILSKRINTSSIFLPSGSHIILVFLYQTSWQFSDEDSVITVASNARGYEKHCEPYPSFRMVPFPMTLNDRKPKFQGHAIIQRRMSPNGTRYEDVLERNTNRDLPPSQECHFEWPWVILNDLAKFFNDTKHRAASLRHLSSL